jgi:hypothetical protein
MDERRPFVNVFAVTHPLWAIADDIQGVSSVGRIEAIQTVTFVDDVDNVEIQTFYFMPTSTDRPDWVFEDDVEGPYNSEEEAKANLEVQRIQPEQQKKPNGFP